MTVKDLIELLQGFPQDLPVVYSKYSEFCMLEPGDVVVDNLCPARPDGWVECRRPDKPTSEYLVLS